MTAYEQILERLNQIEDETRQGRNVDELAMIALDEVENDAPNNTGQLRQYIEVVRFIAKNTGRLNTSPAIHFLDSAIKWTWPEGEEAERRALMKLSSAIDWIRFSRN